MSRTATDPRTTSARTAADRSRAATKNAIARELLYAGILARLWPSYVAHVENDDYPHLLCVDSPAGILTWRLTPDEHEAFEWVPRGESTYKRAQDRVPILHALADGWE